VILSVKDNNTKDLCCPWQIFSNFVLHKIPNFFSYPKPLLGNRGFSNSSYTSPFSKQNPNYFHAIPTINFARATLNLILGVQVKAYGVCSDFDGVEGERHLHCIPMPLIEIEEWGSWEVVYICLTIPNVDLSVCAKFLIILKVGNWWQTMPKRMGANQWLPKFPFCGVVIVAHMSWRINWEVMNGENLLSAIFIINATMPSIFLKYYLHLEGRQWLVLRGFIIYQFFLLHITKSLESIILWGTTKLNHLLSLLFSFLLTLLEKYYSTSVKTFFLQRLLTVVIANVVGSLHFLQWFHKKSS